ncbi:small membrane protein [Streptomyces sp. 769]|nr:small membrane protein [Streptomyces sp. 769]
MIAVALGFLGIAVLGVLALRVFAEVRRLAREVGTATERIQRAAQDLERAAVPLASRMHDVGRDRS